MADAWIPSEVKMPVLAIIVIVLVAWGAGAAAGSASSYLTGALVGVVIFVILVGLFGALAAWRNPSQRDERFRSF
jgi:multisubunit Na+/H+ antiporter MnhE subunit